MLVVNEKDFTVRAVDFVCNFFCTVGTVKGNGHITACLNAEPCNEIFIACQACNSDMNSVGEFIFEPCTDFVAVIFKLLVAMLNKVFFLVFTHPDFITEFFSGIINKVF